MRQRAFQLTEAQACELQGAYHNCQDAQTRTRYQAVRLYGQDYSTREIEAICGYRRSSHMIGVTGVALTPDGRLAVSASHDKTLKVWDVATGRELRMLEGHGESVNGVALSADGRLAVSVRGRTSDR